MADRVGPARAYYTVALRLLNRPHSLFPVGSASSLESPLISDPQITAPRIIPRPEHCISRANISNAALRVLYGLKDAGFKGYLVGGGVRDVLLGQKPKDFDVATDALPEQIKALFPRCLLIGRRFRLAHVRFGREVIEVATFRAAPGEASGDDRHQNDEGRIVRDNAYGTLEEDAWRRDFTVNCLYYDIANFSIVDYTGGMEDLARRQLRLIGDPVTRYREDPVRMLRAVRFAAKLDFEIEQSAREAMAECAPLLADMPAARLYEEVLKLFMAGSAVRSFDLLREHDLFRYLFPQTDHALSRDPQSPASQLVRRGLINTDERVRDSKPVTPAFLFAALLWPAVEQNGQDEDDDGASALQRVEEAGSEAVSKLLPHVSLPRRFSQVTREIWEMQPRLLNYRGQRAQSLLTWPRFRAGYDFLLLQAQSGADVGQRAEWWTKEQEGKELPADDDDAQSGARPARGRSRRRRRRRPDAAEA